MAGKFRARKEIGATGVLVLADGTVFYGTGFGAVGEAVGELCFNTAMAGYQEIMSDPAYANQIINFTFPHVGNTGANPEDNEGRTLHALGCVVGEEVTAPSNFRARKAFPDWLTENGQIGVAGVDTRAVMRRLRKEGVLPAVVAHSPEATFDVAALAEKARNWKGIEGEELTKAAASTETGTFREGSYVVGRGYPTVKPAANAPHVVALDFGGKRAALRQLVTAGARLTVAAPTSDFAAIGALGAEALFLSDGPGDPRETAKYALPVIKSWLKTGKPLFAIGLGHQLLALALGAEVHPTKHGHYGFNHPVKSLETGKVEISEIRGRFAVDRETLPATAKETHVSLFDKGLVGLRLKAAPVFGVQYHPEASARAEAAHPIFRQFIISINAN